MLSTDLSTVWVYLSFALSLLACIFAGIAAQLAMRQVRDERDFRQIILHLQELEDHHEALQASHKRLQSRVGMQDLRARRKAEGGAGSDGELFPDPTANPEEWKRQMRIKLRTK